MKIGYLRFNQFVELDYLNASITNLGTELRCGIIEAFVQMGAEVTILSPCKGTTFEDFKAQRFPKFDYSFAESVSYEPVKVPQGLDFIFVESSATNSLYNYEGRPFIDRTAEVLANTDCPVILYVHSDKSCSVPLARMIRGRVPESKDNHISNIFHARKFVLQRERGWHIWHHALDTKAFDEEYNIKALRYVDLDIPRQYFPMCYSPNFDPEARPEERKVSKDIVYIGAEKNDHRVDRIRYFSHALNGTSFKLHVIGKWPSFANKYGQDLGPVIFHGPLPGHGNVLEVYKTARAVLQIGDRAFEKVGMVTSRIIPAVRSGAVVIADGRIKGIERYVTSELCVADESEFKSLMEGLADVSPEELAELNAEQKNRLVTWREGIESALKRTF